MKLKSIIITLSCLAAAMTMAAGKPNLPKVEIFGKEYYYHEIKRGESIYGIAKKYDWDLEELVKLNPVASAEMKKGERLYYPINLEPADSSPATSTDEQEPIKTEPITHTVKRGETVYSISKQYNIPLDSIYAIYPSTKYGLKAGETLTFPQTVSKTSGKYIYYKIKPGDTLYALAKSNKTSVEDLLDANPGLSEQSFRAGDAVRIPYYSGADKVRTELVEEERVASIESYKVKKHDTWNSISEKTGVVVATLQEANEDVETPEKNEIIAVPVVETVKIEKEIIEEDPRELTTTGIQEIYDSVNQIDRDAEELRTVRVALLLDEPTSNKDLEFSRGILLALDEMRDVPYKIALKVIDGRGSAETVSKDLDDFEPNLLIATADKAFPAFLANYGEENKVEIINAFDIRNEMYEDNASMVQILPPSLIFNEKTADKIIRDYGDRELIFAGKSDENDALAKLLKEKFKGDIREMSTGELHDFTPSDSKSYLIYAYPQKKEDVQEIIVSLDNLLGENPYCEISVVGRQNWVTMEELFREKFPNVDFLIPARCWLDMESNDWKRFADKFNDKFGANPVRSFPNYAVSGYDIARYFIEETFRSGGDYNRLRGDKEKGIQSGFNLERVSNWGGFLNNTGYLLRFRPSGTVFKDEL